MIARITRLLILIQAACALGLSALAVKFALLENSWHALWLGLLAVLIFRLAITCNNFLMARRYRSELPSGMRLGWSQAWRLFFGEFLATMWSSSWSMPFRRFGRHVAIDPTALPVLLVHGYGCNSGYWRSMSKALRRASITHYAIDMEPVLGTIDAYALLIHRAIESICAETGKDKVVIVAHSMGGLAARAYLRDHGSTHVARIITLGTPHHGTALANFSIGANGQQMRWHQESGNEVSSSWLQALKQTEDIAKRALFVSIYSHHDNIIAPQRSSHLPNAKNIELHGIGHVALALHPRVQEIVIDEIRLASRSAGEESPQQRTPGVAA
jgi:triacylglycerol lipase